MVSVTKNIHASRHAPGGADSLSSYYSEKTKLKANLKDYGAVGDGSVDDTASVQNWVNAVCNGGIGGYAPAGVYKLTSSITFPKKPGWSIEGAGKLATTFIMATNNIPIFVLSGTSSTLTHRFRISDMTLDYTNVQTGNTSANCIQYNYECFQGLLRNIDFDGGYYGIGVASGAGGPWGHTFDDLTFNAGLRGGAIEMTGSLNAVPNNHYGRLNVDAVNMVGPIFKDMKGYNTWFDTVEVFSATPNQGPQLMTIQAGAQFNIGAMKFEGGTWTASQTRFIDVGVNAGIRIQELFLGGQFSTLNAPGGTFYLLYVSGSGGIAEVRDITAAFATVTAGNAFIVTAGTGSIVRIGAWRTTSGTFQLQNAGSSVTSDAITVDNIANNHLSYDKGDADYTVADGDPTTIIFNTALTAPRVVNLQNNLNNLFNGMRYRIISSGAVNGTNTIAIKQGSTTLGTLSRDNQAIEFTSRRVPNGTSWFLTAKIDFSTS